MQNEIITYTQHTGEVAARGTTRAVGARESVHKACCPTGTGEGSRRDGFVGTQKAVRARESVHSSAQASGRSMIEMIGVLAIIGVLSVGALSGYRMAMTKYRANEVVDYVMRVGEAAAHHGTTQKTGLIPYTGNDRCKDYVNEEEAPLDMYCYINNASALPVFVLKLGLGSYSTELGAAIKKQIGICDNATRYPCAYTLICPDWIVGPLVGQPCVQIEFKR